MAGIQYLDDANETPAADPDLDTKPASDPDIDTTEETGEPELEKKAADALNNEPEAPLQPEPLCKVDRMMIALKRNKEKLKGVQQSKLEVHFTTTNHAKAKETQIWTWMRILSEEEDTLSELAQHVDNSRFVGPHGEEP
jgi:hypothetical protein